MIFSIVIPAKNEQENIIRCLESIERLCFSKNDFEVILVDNGSDDGTVASARVYGVNAYVKPELSLSELRNYGAEVARGDFFAFLDADCMVAVDWLNQAEIAFADPRVGATGSTPVAPENGTWVEKVWSSFRTRRKNRYFASWINSSNFFVRREMFQKIGGFNAKVKTCEDVDICMRLNKICKILFDPSVKVIHLGEPKSLHQFFLKEVWRGKGSYSGLVSHGIRLSELKSLMLPVYYLLTTAGIVVAACVDLHFGFIMLVLYMMPAIAFSCWVVAITRKTKYFFGYFLLFLVYVNARTVSIFSR